MTEARGIVWPTDPATSTDDEGPYTPQRYIFDAHTNLTSGPAPRATWLLAAGTAVARRPS